MYAVKLVGPELEGKDTVPKYFESLPTARVHARKYVPSLAEYAEIFDATGVGRPVLDVSGLRFLERVGTKATPWQTVQHQVSVYEADKRQRAWTKFETRQQRRDALRRVNEPPKV